VIVVDASVLATALGDDGPDGDRARDRLRGERLSAPELVDLEVTSVLRRQVQSNAADLRRAALALADLVAMPLRRAPHRPLLARCWELRDNLTVYDASYVALAEALDVTLLTGDRRLARAPGLRCHIEILRPAPLSGACPNFRTCPGRVAGGFCRTCVIDGLLEHSPVEHVAGLWYRRNHQLSGSLIYSSRHFSPRPASHRTPTTSRWSRCSGCWACASSRPTGADIADLGEEHGHRVLRVCGKGTKVVLVPLPPAVGRSIGRLVTRVCAMTLAVVAHLICQTLLAGMAAGK